VKLKRLIVQGFKSFKDRTTIHFDQGITGIVGPNGCGKSNIVDALFWVMGEQSAKHLRGSSMKDVIFAGSSKYSPGSFAEATLVLENDTGKHIHISNKVSSPSEIQLTRKLYRNGESEYRINGEPARLKDIQEVFMDTGAGAKSYSIIAQGEINRLVQAKPEERRMMIEEVAGITKFKLRKRDSLKKIELTQSNLARLQDLQIEIEKNLKNLEKQAEKAERARTLKEKIQRNDLVVHAHKVHDLLKNYRDGHTAINERTLEVEGWQTRRGVLELNLEDERLQRDEKTSRIEDLQKEYNELSRQLAAAEEKLNYLCKNLSEKESLLEGREKESSDLLGELEERRVRLEELRTAREAVLAQGAEEVDFSSLQDRVDLLKDQLEGKEEELSSVNETLQALREKKTELDQQNFRNSSKLDEYAAGLQDLTKEIEALEKQYSGVSTQIADEREAVQQAETRHRALVEKENELKLKLTSMRSRRQEIEQASKEATKTLIQAESRLSSLKEINASLEGLKEGSREFLKVSEGGFELLGNLIRCDDKYGKAVQTLLAGLLDVVVATDGGNLKLGEWLATNPEAGIDFLSGGESVVSNGDETAERLALAGLVGVTSLSSILEIPAHLKSLLEGLFVVEAVDFERFNALSAQVRFKAICSVDGTSIIRNYSGVKLFSRIEANAQGQGVIERNNLIEKLSGEMAEITAQAEQLNQSGEAIALELRTLENELEIVRNDSSQAMADHASRKSALESKLKNTEAGTARLDILKNRKSEISKNRLTLLESEEGLTRSLKETSTELEEMISQKSSLEEEIDLLQDQYSQEREELLAKQMEARTFEDRVKSFESQIADVEAQMNRQETKLAHNSELVEKYREEIVQTEASLKEVEEGNKTYAQELQEREDVLAMGKDDLAQLLMSMKEREDEVKELGQKVNRAEKELVELESKAGQILTEEAQITRDIFEKYRIDLRKTLGNFLNFTEDDFAHLSDISSMYTMDTEDGPKELVAELYEFHRRYGQDLKECENKLKGYRLEFSRLGEINWQAIEDYERQKLRFDFLRIQEAELKQSLEDLQRAISHIDEKSRERFKIAFEEVNTRFEKVFPIIFGGGSARLNVTGNLEDAECGIDIIAQPPGKKMQNINLMSGGEKAMTAVSLIFSIFLVKPSPFCLLDEVDAPLDDANVGRFNELLREMSKESQFILITHNKKTMELNDTLYGVTMQEPGVSKAVSVQLQ
jgi:chromosome segregation protein